MRVTLLSAPMIARPPSLSATVDVGPAPFALGSAPVDPVGVRVALDEALL
jgi:hypothetical protein